MFLTERGEILRDELLLGRLATIRSLLMPLSGADQDALASLLHKMLASMDTTDLERCNLCRLCDGRVCTDCPLPADFRSESLVS